MKPERLQEGLRELIRQASVSLPPDVEIALTQARAREGREGARGVLDTICENISEARRLASPICQDTGFPTFWFRFPAGTSLRMLRSAAEEALAAVTAEGLLRPNAVDPVSGSNSGSNVGAGAPALYFEEHDGDGLEADLLLKGGGSENVGSQCRLPDASIRAGRDLEGVRRAVLRAIHEAQGFGCAPGIIGVAIGGDRAGSMALAKRQLLRPVGRRAEDPALAALEDTLLEQANTLGIGAMGFGGDTTVLGVHVGKGHRHPASFFVSVAYGCWALRRKRLALSPDGSFRIQEVA
ncbi:MAG: fumarate hydratase [Deltaproteobacteria bacterium]|nr:fumarate hydratase [Deltaproteobacteria bacterium]